MNKSVVNMNYGIWFLLNGISIILILCDIIELWLYVVFNGWYVMYDA